MTAEEIVSAWRTLRTLRVPGEDLSASALVKVSGVETALELAVDSAGDLHLLAPVSGPSELPVPADCNGLRLRLSILDDSLCLDLQSPAHHEPLFAALCAQVIAAIAVDAREPWAAAIAVIGGWQSAFRPKRRPMSLSEQIGLAGELLLLRIVWVPALGPAAVHHWSGPDGERHDFTSASLDMEVKATIRSRHEHEISRIDQLQAQHGRRLVLASVQLEQSVAGELTLASLIDAVIDDIRHDPQSVDGFLTRLGGLDWSDDLRDTPDLLRFNLRDVQVFEVDDEFPSLPADFCLPAGVLSVRYVISLANLPVLDAAEIISDVGRLNHLA